MTGLDVATLRAGFPSLSTGIAHFDGPGGTQTPAVVGEAVARTLTGPLSNRGSGLVSETNAEEAIAGFRHALADLLGARPEGIVYGRSATQITYDFARTIAKAWGPGDDVVVSELDHDSNVRPWVQVAKAVGATVRWLPLDPATGDLDLSGIDGVVTGRTRLVALTAASNLLGTQPRVAEVAEAAHAVGALVYVDGVHHTAHASVDVTDLGADFYVCSPYKFFGPHCAALAADPDLLATLSPDKLVPSTDAVPERFELGTLPYELMAGATAAVDVIAGIAPEGGSRRERLVRAHEFVREHEDRLRRRVEGGLAELGDHLTVHSVAEQRTPTLFFTFGERDATEAYRFLGERDVLAPAGSFYAYEPFRALGLPVDSGMRVGLAPYTDDSDVDRLLTGLREFLA